MAATDPLNLVGITSPGPRVPAVLGNAVLYCDGVPVASREAGALVERATHPDERCVRGTLAELPELAARHGVRPPAVIVVGRVTEAAATVAALEPQHRAVG